MKRQRIKNYVLMSFFLTSLSAIANDKYVCTEYSAETKELKQITVVISKQSNPRNPNQTHLLESFSDSQLHPTIKAYGTLKKSDETLHYAFDARVAVGFKIYARSLDQAVLSAEGKEYPNPFVCR